MRFHGFAVVSRVKFLPTEL